MLMQILLSVIPTFILCQTVINTQSKDFCPSSSGSSNRIPRLQIRSVLVRCPNKGEFHIVKSGADDRTNISVVRTQDLMEFFGYDTDEPLLHSEITSCRRKLVVTIQMTNCGRTKTEEEFILIDQVYDPVLKLRVRLLNPMVFKIRQHQVEQSYGLNIQHIVNAEATEEVLNKNNRSFLGCETSGLRPTCGYSYYHDEVIPYSEGFCCSCDPYINVLRQPDSLRTPPLSPIAFTSREGQFPQGYPPKATRKGLFKLIKRKTEPTLKESIDDIYSCFAAKIKSFMYPANRRINELKGNELLPELRPHRSLFRLSQKYYNIPPLNPAKGFKMSDIRIETKPDIDPWAIALTLNETEKKKNRICLDFNRMLGKYASDPKYKRSLLSEPGLIEELLMAENLCNNTDLELLRDVMLTSGKRSVFSHYYDPGAAIKFGHSCKMPITPDEYNANEYFINAVQNLNDSDWINELLNPYKDNGAICGRNYSAFSTEAPPSTPNIHKHQEISKKFRKRPRSKRQITASGTQVRGGQSCLDRHTPAEANPETYHESAHCLRFSELWYNVYRLKSPFVSHMTEFQLFEKHTYEAGNSHWADLSRGLRIHLGTFNRHIVNNKRDPTLVFTYTPLSEIQKEQFCLNPSLTTMLVPRPLPKEKEQKFPQVAGGPKEYLLVRPEDISFDGEDCDKAGVSFKAFAKQPSRCNNIRGTCLRNQPLQLWRHDTAAKKCGRSGKYFLENYARISDEPIKFHKEVGDFLSLDFTGSYQSVVEVEVPIDRNGLVSSESLAQLSEIYIDSTCEHQTRITVLVTNTGLTSSAFYPRLKGCPPEIPQVWTENEGPVVYIAPQKIHRYRLSLYGKLPVSRFHCSIELLNKKHELVATRRIRIQHFDRCVCMWHCLCACIGSISGLRCDHMSLEHYHAAGFSGALPVDTADPAYEPEESSASPFVLKEFLLYLAYVYTVFLLLGLLKFLLGLLFVYISNYGLWLLFECEAKNMTKYKESYWAFTHLVRDSQCYPVSPAGRSRQIQILSKPAQAIVNIFFFCILPGIVLLKLPCACCNVCCTTLFLIKMELFKTEWIRNCCQQGICKLMCRCWRRTKRTWRRNIWLPLCCFWNPFFLYSLCKPKSVPECQENEKVKPSKSTTTHKKGTSAADKKKHKTVHYMIQSQLDGPDEIEKLLASKKNFIKNDLKRDHEFLGKNLFTLGQNLQFNDEEDLSSTYIVKTRDYPNLDRKTIKYVVKNIKKGFSNVMNQVIKIYKAQKMKQDSRTLIKEVEDMKNKMMRNVISNITKSAIYEVIKTKDLINDRTGVNSDKDALKPIAEQVTQLIDRCFKEIVRRKTGGAKLNKLIDGQDKSYDKFMKDDRIFNKNNIYKGNEKKRARLTGKNIKDYPSKLSSIRSLNKK